MLPLGHIELQTQHLMMLFLDDYRNPIDCFSYMHSRIGNLNSIYLEKDWCVVKNYPQFIKAVDKFSGQLTHVSFDHDLVDSHYVNPDSLDYNSDYFITNDSNKTGYHAALYLKFLYQESGIKLPIILVHSMNIVGVENIYKVFNDSVDSVGVERSDSKS